ncbi:DALR anticodon-binding domain-containing protein 3 [Microplitis mediator]|uniref:DALR anticodon-binding domain-containing protein 3 n=1 Tax=Microplitis mediator TaxID=375433 RepID=UPI0025534355|nr:DALR anticodon-binding domain-containing protein 3 [Microplitis mediator]
MNEKHIAEYLMEELMNNKNTSIKTKAIKIIESGKLKNRDIIINLNISIWKSLIDNDDKVLNKSKNILDYYLKKRGINISDLLDQFTEALKYIGDKKWRVAIDNLTLGNGEVFVTLNKKCLINNVIRDAIKLKGLYGKRSDGGKIYLEINEDFESSLTTTRLNLLKNICGNVLKTLGFEIDDNAERKLFLTTKSQGDIGDGFDRCLCGVVKNPRTNAKETELSYSEYLEQKVQLIKEANDSRPVDDIGDQQLKVIAEAVITFEFMSVKPSHPCFIKVDSDADKAGTCNRGGTFVLYNLARITKILDKFQHEVNSGKYPELWDIDKVDLHLLNSEEEWNLIYNYIYDYPFILTRIVEIEANGHCKIHPQILCSFLLNISQKFSNYYRRYRILTDGRSQLLKEMMRRIYLLKALQIIFNNALDILNVTSISRM